MAFRADGEQVVHAITSILLPISDVVNTKNLVFLFAANLAEILIAVKDSLAQVVEPVLLPLLVLNT